MGLDYDNSAFYYFSMTMLGIYVVPTTVWALNYSLREYAARERTYIHIIVPLAGALFPAQRDNEEARTSKSILPSLFH